MGQLSLLLADLPGYRIGDGPVAPDAATARLLAECADLPGWRLLHDAQADHGA